MRAATSVIVGGIPRFSVNVATALTRSHIRGVSGLVMVGVVMVHWLLIGASSEITASR
jgi:hypothetical protein